MSLTPALTPAQEWWSPAEIAEASLPDMPNTKRRVNAMAERLAWASNIRLARRRKGRGGGWEFHWSLFRDQAKLQLLRQAGADVRVSQTAPVPVVPDRGRDAMWQAFEALPDGPRATAERRLMIIQRVDQLVQIGSGRAEAVCDAAQMEDVSPRSVWNWLGLVEHVAVSDRLAYLAPRHRLGSRRVARTQIDPLFTRVVTSDWLRLSKPSLTSCYDRTVRIAQSEGVDVPSLQAVRRWISREVSKPRQIFLREGSDALKRYYPSQVRDKTAMHAMEGVNGDFHRFDVFVKFPGRNGAPDEIFRPQMVAFQDVYSGRILCWRVATSANSHTVQLAIGDMIEQWGIPKHVLLDNGREFAAVAITGGAPTRSRFKIRDDDIPGLLTVMGCEVHWATPYSGQSKPIERAFRDLCDRVAKHPEFEGAYTGNRPDAKPENYGSRAVPLDKFLAVLEVEMQDHNARTGRRTEIAWGRSFAEVFDESYATARIQMATPEQRRFWLMGVEGIKANAKNGQMRFMSNEYWSEWMYRIAGQKVVARFDREALWDGLHIYSLDNAYLGHAACMKRGEFFDVDDGNYLAQKRNAWTRKVKAAARAEDQLTAAELALMHAELPSPEPVTQAATPSVVGVDFAAETRRRRSEAGPREEASRTAAELATIGDLTARLQSRSDTEETKQETFDRALELEARIARGDATTKEQRKWLNIYQQSSDYRAHRLLHERLGAGAVGAETPKGTRNV